ncbi:putative ubiquitin [Medicago truncatula]|uniref:Putative ubiquitin n=1 Tax=Medicago truncatula TaxID=3880 RepID=G7KFP4_MEDTR|nr:ubiquitin-60S ribosomal protein [Medicago truncatula]RHN56801.1 putative ubiquitin [Medicago truncatula]
MNSSSVPMQIFINIEYGMKSFPLMVKSSDTILSVQEKIHDNEKIPVHDQELYFSNAPLDYHRTLASYNIQDKSTIDLVVRIMAD